MPALTYTHRSAASSSVDEAFLEYFRCPERFAIFAVCCEPLSDNQGYFRFGNATCFGRCAGERPSPLARAGLPDLSRLTTQNGDGPALPFGLADVARNLRYELYTQESPHILEAVTARGIARSLYYLARPLLPVAVRRHLQKIRLAGWARIPFPRWPVDDSVDVLMQEAMALQLTAGGVEEVPFVWFWPDGAQSAAIVTHDVEGSVSWKFTSQLMDLDDSFGVRSAFQLIPELPRAAPEALFREVRDRGFEANLHDWNHDGFLFQSEGHFQTLAAKINRFAEEFGCRGFRSGAMYREQLWFEHLAISYDMSVPNVAHLEPQRGGCCTVMPYFISHVLELPLTTLQDYSLFHILGDYSIDLWKKQIERIRSRHGLISVLTHPDYLTTGRARAVYADLLTHLCELRGEQGIWLALPGEVDAWWRERSQMTVVPHGGSWRATGPGSERASVAYASIVDGSLTFRVEKSF